MTQQKIPLRGGAARVSSATTTTTTANTTPRGGLVYDKNRDTKNHHRRGRIFASPTPMQTQRDKKPHTVGNKNVCSLQSTNTLFMIRSEIAGIETQENLKHKIDNLDQRQNNWIDVATETFSFCTYAKKAFEEGTFEDKRIILSTLGSNLTLKDGKLNLQAKSPFITIGKTFKKGNF